MFCTKCGENNSDTATYCRKCGELIEGEAETQVAARPAAETAAVDGQTVFSIGPTLLFVKAGYGLAAIGAVLLVGVLSVFSVAAMISIPLALCLFLVPAFYNVRQKLVRYTLTDSQIEVDEGLISRTTRNIPIRRIQDVTVSTSVLQRMLGFGDVVIDNASEEGGKIVLKNINSPKEYADKLLKQVSRLDR